MIVLTSPPLAVRESRAKVVDVWRSARTTWRVKWTFNLGLVEYLRSKRRSTKSPESEATSAQEEFDRERMRGQLVHPLSSAGGE
jgi:hypothetical protein